MSTNDNDHYNNRRVTILYGSQTGTAQEVAERLTRELKRRHFSIKTSAIDDYDWNAHLFQRSSDENDAKMTVIFVVATTGQGDQPDNMTRFWRAIMRKNFPHQLSHLQFAVLGLGDSSYPKYNFVAKKLHRRLLQLGASEFCERGLADDQDVYGVDSVLVPWMETMLNKVLELYPLPSHLSIAPADVLPPSRYRVSLVACDTANQDAKDQSNSVHKAYGETHPFNSRILENTRLTDVSNEQDVRHIVFDISAQNTNASNSSSKESSAVFAYEPGDVLAMWPKNEHDSIIHGLKRWNLDENQWLLIEKADPDAPDIRVPGGPHGSCVTVRAYDLFEKYLAINGTPRRYFFELLSHFTKDEEECDRLQWFGCSDGVTDLNRYNNREKRTFLEAMDDFPKCTLDLNYLLDLIPPIVPRYFSISSAQQMYPNQIHITVSVVKFTTPYKRERYGMCSSWLSRLTDVHKGISVPIWVRKGTMKFPPAPAPVLLIGPGTGMAPFRSLIQQRCVQAREGKQVGQTVLFFGNRYSKRDYLYGQELERYSGQNGFSFKVVTAFSRDQADKIYVQHRIKENSKMVWDIIHNQGGFVYIAGNAKQMPTDVRNALLHVIKTEAGADDAQAEDYLSKLEAMRRLQQETWS